MKKILLLLALFTALCLVGCTNNEQNNNNNEQSNTQVSDKNQNNDEKEKENESGIVVYEKPDFSKKAGFKVNLGSGLEEVKYDSIFLIHDTTAQLDLIFPDNSIGTLLVDTNGYQHLANSEDSVLIEDIKVAIEIGADGIIVYEWVKDDVCYTYSTAKDIKDSDVLATLVNNVVLEKTNS